MIGCGVSEEGINADIKAPGLNKWQNGVDINCEVEDDGWRRCSGRTGSDNLKFCPGQTA